MTHTSFNRLVLELGDAELRTVLALLEDLDALAAREMVLDVRLFDEELLPRLAAVVRFLGTKRRVRVAGMRAGQVRRLAALGIQPEEILVGHWPTPHHGQLPD